jgi:hypothetical protein
MTIIYFPSFRATCVDNLKEQTQISVFALPFNLGFCVWPHNETAAIYVKMAK